MLRMTQTWAKLGIQTTLGKMEIRSTRAKVNIKQTHAKIKMDSELPKISIDQYPCRKTSGLMNIWDLTKDNAAYAKQSVMKFISACGNRGEMLSNIPQMGRGKAIAAMSKQYSVHKQSFGMKTLPSERPIIGLRTESDLKIWVDPPANPTHPGVELSPEPGSVNYNYTPTKVDVFMKQYAELKIEYLGEKVDVTL